MAVLGDRKQRTGAGVAAREDHRNFIVERHETFQHAGLATEFAERGTRLLARRDPHLALAVVAEARHFQERRCTDLGERLVEIALAVDQRERCRGETVLREPGFLVAAVLHDGDRVRAGRHPAIFRQRDEACRGYILEFRGDSGACLAQLMQCRFVGVGRLQVHVGHLSGRARRVGVEHHHPVAHGARGDGEHAAELAAAQDAQRRIRQDRRRLTRHRAVPWPAPSPPDRGGSRRAGRPVRCRGVR